MALLTDIFSLEELNYEIDGGYITSRSNEAGTLAVLNYTPATQYSRRWNKVTMACRGLIFDTETLEIVARPFPKFFNHNEELAPRFADDEPVRVLDKADGSLIVAAWYKDRFICSSRGSFQSEQAIAAQAILDSTMMTVEMGTTYTFELVGPGNRIVLAYPEDTLIFLGTINNETGEYRFPLEGETPFQSVQEFKFSNMREALSAPPRPNAEGYIIRGESGVVKWKQEDYVIAHRLVTNLTPKNIWRAMVEGKTLAEIKEPFPDEFYAEIDDTYNDIISDARAIGDELCNFYNGMDRDVDRKEYAMQVMQAPKHLRGLLFMLADSKSVYDVILKMVEPMGNSPLDPHPAN